MRCQRVDLLLEQPEHGRVAAPPRLDRAVGQRDRAVGHQQVRIGLQLNAQPLAVGAGAEVAVERKMPRRQLAETEAGGRIGE